MEETLGKRIAACRKKLGLTQDALAEKLGVTAQAVSKWENDQSCPDITMLPRLAEIFDITTDELLGVSRPSQPQETIPAEEPPPQQEQAPPPQNSLRTTLTVPGATLALWVFLTGIVTAIDVIRRTPIGFWDIAIACGIFAFGLCGVLRRFSVLRMACVIGGVCFLFNILFLSSLAAINWELPLSLGLAALGLDLLLHTLRRPHSRHFGLGSLSRVPEGVRRQQCTCEGETFSCATYFGENNYLITLPRLSGGEAEAAFGSVTVDLSACEELAPDCRIQADCSFAEMTILVPRRFRVELSPSSAFGNVEQRGTCDPEASQTLQLHCNASFGQITLRYI